jgi:hypothetical protein
MIVICTSGEADTVPGAIGSYTGAIRVVTTAGTI